MFNKLYVGFTKTVEPPKGGCLGYEPVVARSGIVNTSEAVMPEGAPMLGRIFAATALIVMLGNGAVFAQQKRSAASCYDKCIAENNTNRNCLMRCQGR